MFVSLDNTFEKENDIALQKLVYDVALKKNPKMKPLMIKITKNTGTLFWYAKSNAIGVLEISSEHRKSICYFFP